MLFDGANTRTWGGMTFIIHAAIGGDMNAGEFGMDGGWGGTRTTSAFVGKFPEVGGTVVAPVYGTNNFPLLNVPGGYQGWDPANNSTALVSPEDNGVYTGYIFVPGNELQFKFAAGSWDTNWGDTGADGTLEPGGDNITAPGEGFYRLVVDLNTLTYTFTPSEWGLIGSATAGGWDSDQNMTYNAAEGAWEITTDLVAGEVKFRMNDGWDINLGDDGGDAVMEGGGANIAIPGGGNYTLKLYLGQAPYTYSITSNVNDFRKLFFTQNQTWKSPMFPSSIRDTLLPSSRM
ncbi:MAG: SusF/SusE family outer membrane protein [Saprospiraceae bacterium]